MKDFTSVWLSFALSTFPASAHILSVTSAAATDWRRSLSLSLPNRQNNTLDSHVTKQDKIGHRPYEKHSKRQKWTKCNIITAMLFCMSWANLKLFIKKSTKMILKTSKTFTILIFKNSLCDKNISQNNELCTKVIYT